MQLVTAMMQPSFGTGFLSVGYPARKTLVVTVVTVVTVVLYTLGAAPFSIAGVAVGRLIWFVVLVLFYVVAGILSSGQLAKPLGWAWA